MKMRHLKPEEKKEFKVCAALVDLFLKQGRKQYKLDVELPPKWQKQAEMLFLVHFVRTYYTKELEKAAAEVMKEMGLLSLPKALKEIEKREQAEVSGV